LKTVSMKQGPIYWREKILQSILGVGLIFGLFAFVPMTRMAIQEEIWYLIFLNTAAYIFALFIFRYKGISYSIRAAVTLFLAFAIGFYVVFFFGLLSGGPFCLFAFVVLAGLLLGLRAAIVALITNALVLFLFGWFAAQGQWAQDLPFFPTPMRGIVAWATYVLMNTVTAVAAALLVRGMQKMAEKELSTSIELRDEHEKLMLEIKERGKAVTALRKSEKQYRLLAENVTDTIWILSLDTLSFAYVSPSVIRARGVTSEEAMAQNLSDVVPPESLESVTSVLSQELEKDGKAGIDPERSRTLEIQQSQKDGSYRWAEATMTFIRDDDGKPVEILGVTRDIHDRKQSEKEKETLETKLQQAHKMEAIATLAGGIAHQFNNALSIVMGRMEILDLNLSDEKVKKNFTPVKKTFDRMAGLTQQLITYARGGKYQAASISMTQFVKNTLPLIEHTVTPSINVETDLPPNIPVVMADAAQMQMVLSALLSNSSEAIQEKGYIRISCREVILNEKEVDDVSPDIKQGRYVKLTVRDSGRGMDKETRNRIFEPFYTTKFQGRGLGMAAVYGIIKNHGGWVFVESELGEGTSVHIYMPVTEEKESAAKIQAGEEPALLEGTGTVLLIEDEELVMDVSRTILERLGYQVISACAGKEAVERNIEFKGEIDLALLDIKLPDMKAIDIYTELKSSRPNMKVIVYSGFSKEGAAIQLMDAGADAFIQKPFSIYELSKKIDEIRKT